MTNGLLVGQSGRDPRFPERVAQVCAGVAIAIALLALAGWATGRLILASFHADFIPLSPTSALAFLLLGEALLVGDRQRAHPRSRWLACAAVTLVMLVGLLILGQHLTGTDLGLERWLSRSSATFGQVLIGRMSPLTAGTFIVASLAMLTLVASPAGWRLAREAAASAAVGVMVVGILVALGYWRGVAFLSGGSLIPMALPGALAFVLLGAGILAAGGPRVWTMRDYRPVAAGLTVGLAVSISLFVLATWQERDRIHAEFERKADAFVLAFHDRFRGNLSELENLRTLFTVSTGVDRETFRTFTLQIMDHHPGIQAFSWSPVVTDGERAAYEARARRDGLAAYQFTERSSDGRLVPAQRRPTYVPIFYQEPYVGNEAVLGFDNLSNPARRAALEKARDTGQASATEAITLVQKTGQKVGILIYQPVYRAGTAATPAQRRAHLLGFLVEVLHLGDSLRTSFPNLDREGLEYRLVDATATHQEDLIIASAGAKAAARAGITFSSRLTVADRQWRLELYAAPWYLAAKQSGHAWLVLASGLFLTILLVTYLLASARHTAEVTRLSEDFRKISRAVEHSPAAVVITDTTGAIEYVNPKFAQVTGYAAEEVRGQTPRILKSGETPPEEYQRLWTTITAGGEWRGEFHNKKKSGELFWEAASISPVKDSEGHISHFVAIKEDITERKRTEEAARRHALQLEVVRAVGIEITRELDLTAVLHLITERVVGLVGGGQGMIRLWDEDSQSLVQKIFTGSDLNQNSAPLRLGEGVAGAAAQRRQGIIVNEFRTSPYAIPHLLDGTRHTAVLAEPLLYGDRLVGVLSILREAGQQAFTEEDQQILAIFAAEAAIAIENARLFKDAQNEVTERKTAEAALAFRMQQLEALRAVSAEITCELGLSALLQLITDRMAELVAGGQSMIRLWDEDGQWLVPRAYTGRRAHWADRRLRLGEGVAGTAAQQRQGLIVNDFRISPYVTPRLREGTTHTAVLAEPLLFGDRLVGVISIEREADQPPFTEKDQQLLALFATQAAIAIENARLHETALRRSTELEALLLSSKAIGSSLELDHVLEVIAQQASTISAAPIVRLFLLDEDVQLLRCRVAVGFPLKDEPDLTIPLGASFSGQVAVTGEPLTVPDTRLDPRTYYPAHASKYGVVSYLGLPVKFQERILGVLVFNTPAPRQYSADEMAYLSSFASQAAIAIENARLYETTVRRGAQLEALLSSLRTVTSGLDLREILDRILDEAIRISGAPHVKVLLLDTTNKALRVGAVKGSGMLPADTLPVGAGHSGLVAQSGEPLFIADVQNDPESLRRDQDRGLGIVSYLGLPIKKGDEVLGVLTFNTTVPYQYSPGEMILLTSFAAQAAIAIENARLHEAITQHAETLEARVQERTTELARTNLDLTAALRQAEAGNQAKNDFLINMSHELRTPLNAILGFAQILQGQAKEGLTDKQRRYLDNIYSSGQHLLAIVNEILDLNTTEEGLLALHVTKVNLAEVITEALEATREAAHRKGHAVHALIPPDLPVFDADRDRIRQIAICLLSNAVKFTPDGGTISVAARRISNFQFPMSNLKEIGPEHQSQIANHKSPRHDFVEIAVADTGIGIRAEDLPRLFQMFGQLESPLTKRYAGTGVGLVLAKRLVELHGGTITASSEGEGKGSTFTVRFPVDGPVGTAEA